jgi:hypothetical protein
VRGIYCVAFGEPARRCARQMIASVRQWMPGVPIALCSDRALGPEDVLVRRRDADVGGRLAKLGMYELTPQEWDAVLYLDADTKLVADVGFLFDVIEDGWQLAICLAIVQEMRHYPFVSEEQRRRTRAALGTLKITQWSSGVMAFGRDEETARLFKRWRREWRPAERRDQAALMRAIYRSPVRVYTLGYEWNTVANYVRSRNIVTAGVMHYPMRARRPARGR